MNWDSLKGEVIKRFYYFDEDDGTGFFNDDDHFRILESGFLTLELENGQLLDIYMSSEESDFVELVLEESDDISMEDLEKQYIENDPLWKGLYDFKIREVDRSSPGLTITLELSHGEKIFVSNGGYLDDERIGPIGLDLMIYRKRKIGERYGLL